MISTALRDRWSGRDEPFLITDSKSLVISEILATKSPAHLKDIREGDVVGLVGDFDATSITDLLSLVDRKAVVVPLTGQTRAQHGYFFENALVNWVVEAGISKKLGEQRPHPLLAELRARSSPGLVLFSTGTTGQPKAILHDFGVLLKKFFLPRPAFRTMAFLLFDHIGGINTLLHTLFNGGVVISLTDRSVQGVIKDCHRYRVEVLPTTPTFLRMMLMAGLVPEAMPDCLRVITYGTERMDQHTLDAYCSALPDVEFRQTFGMSELGILRVKSKARDSLFMRVGGDGVETRVTEEGVLKIFSPNRMLGYLNAASPFEDGGWFNTGDVVESDGDYLRVVGRVSETINVGGLKFMASEVEAVALQYPGVALVSVRPRNNPVTGQHIEVKVEIEDQAQLDIGGLRDFFAERLPSHMIPRRITVGKVDVGHRFKKV
jgi:acyl-CoA synthetase (AMP-forming)/AMP-acid ligase II